VDPTRQVRDFTPDYLEPLTAMHLNLTKLADDFY
jgi:hypothetical protein